MGSLGLSQPKADNCGATFGTAIRGLLEVTHSRIFFSGLILGMSLMLSDLARAEGCAMKPVTAPITLPGTLYQKLAARTDARMLAMAVVPLGSAQTCRWVYAVRLLTKTGAVVDLDYAIADLKAVAASWPDGDLAALGLLDRLGVDTATIDRIGPDSDRAATDLRSASVSGSTDPANSPVSGPVSAGQSQQSADPGLKSPNSGNPPSQSGSGSGSTGPGSGSNGGSPGNGSPGSGGPGSGGPGGGGNGAPGGGAPGDHDGGKGGHGKGGHGGPGGGGPGGGAGGGGAN